jgi:hypothetical protein
MGIIRLNVCGLAVAAISIASVVPVALAQAPVAGEKKEAPAPRFPMPQGPRVTSPEVTPDGRVTFRILAQAIRATGRSFPGRSRPLCPYPSHAHCKGTGDVEDAASFECR